MTILTGQSNRRRGLSGSPARRLHSLRNTALGLLAGALPLLTAPMVAAQPATDEQLLNRSGAWDESLRLEKSGRPAVARSLLTWAWGEQPTSYEVALRIGWLSLALTDGERAAAAYHQAGGLPGADLDAQVGLSSALTMTGYDDYADGDYTAARRQWRDALSLHPGADDARRGLILVREQRFDPELWLSFVGTSAPDESLAGGSALLYLPLQVADWLVLRAAFRHLESSVTRVTSVESPMGPGRTPSRRWSENDVFAGLGVGLPWLWLDAWGTGLFLDGDKPVGGEAARLRIGRRWGLTLDQAALGRKAGWNVQLAPQAFIWPLPELGFSAGTHLTLDEIGNDVSAIAGISLVTKPVEIHVQGHVGPQRWPVSLDGPTVTTTDGNLTVGGKLTVMVPMSEQWALGLQGQVAQLELDSGKGLYGTAALGLRWSPHWFLDEAAAPHPQTTTSAGLLPVID